ncbi:MAG: lipopolysaccharide assembly protein LapB [Sulfurifustis sp.]
MSFSAYDLLWLLLPLAAASGWFVARYDAKRQSAKSFDLPSAYFKGLNFLLNEQPDKAIEIFIQVLEVNSETVETHLALGNLFRRRGEVERAIRIHQNLIARPTLSREQRTYALLELGQDYFKAGLFDRAENLFLELAEVRAHSEQALRLLLSIYQQEKEWDKAIQTGHRLARVNGKPMNEVIAHYYCELAEQAVGKKNYAAAREQLEQALAADPNCVRASIVLGDIEAREGRYREAIAAWRRVEDQDEHYFGEVAGRIADAYRRLNDEEGLYEFFSGALKRHAAISITLTFADVVKRRDGAKAAEKFIVDSLRRQPNVHGLQHLIDISIEQAQGAAKTDLLLLKGIIEELRQQHQGYACQQCGFRGRTLHWLCPSCTHWNTIKPVVEA